MWSKRKDYYSVRQFKFPFFLIGSLGGKEFAQQISLRGKKFFPKWGNGIGQKGLHTVRQENDEFCKKYLPNKRQKLNKRRKVKEGYLFFLDSVKKI